MGRGGRIRAVGPPDLLIAAVAERERVAVLRPHGNYKLIAQVTGLPTQWVVPRGTVDGSTAGAGVRWLSLLPCTKWRRPRTAMPVDALVPREIAMCLFRPQGPWALRLPINKKVSLK